MYDFTRNGLECDRIKVILLIYEGWSWAMNWPGKSHEHP